MGSVYLCTFFFGLGRVLGGIIA